MIRPLPLGALVATALLVGCDDGGSAAPDTAGQDVADVADAPDEDVTPDAGTVDTIADPGADPGDDPGDDPADAEADADTHAADVGPDVEPTGHPIGLPAPATEHPSLLVTPDRKPEILARVDQEPYASILARVEQRAGRSIREQDEGTWDYHVQGQNGETAQANAMLAWLFDDEEAAGKAVEILGTLDTNLGDTPDVDVHIRMPRVLMGHANALDLLLATPWITPEQATDARERILTLTGKLVEDWVEGIYGDFLLGLAQNNYIVRTAASVGYVALAFPDAPDAAAWADWAFGELAYMFDPVDGHYLQADGGLAEDVYYGNFSFSPALATFLAWDNLVGEPREFATNCTTRAQEGPHADHGCVDGAPVAFENPLHDPTFRSIGDWHLGLRMPNGARAVMGDARFIGLNGGALLSSFTGEGHLVWDLVDNPARPMETNYGVDLAPHHLVYVDESVEVAPPTWTTRFFEESGHAVFRSGWGPDDRWLMLVAEHGDARQTLHDHADETSFSMAAYGEYLLVDTGYYKPDPMNNARTADAWAHSVVLIDGQMGPVKGKVVDTGGVDAALEHTRDGEHLDFAQARMTYQGTTVSRGVAFVRDRWFLVADRLEASPGQAPREHRWRVHGNAGLDRGGLFEVLPDRARFERDAAGVDVALASTAPGMTLEEPPYEPLTAPHVHEIRGHDDVGHHGVVDGVVEAPAPSYLAVLAPYRTGTEAEAEDAPLDVAPVDLGDGVAAWRITSAGAVDLAVLREQEAATSFTLHDGTAVETDADVTLLTLEGGPPVALLAGGTAATVDGETVLETGGAPVVFAE
ncbi:MAG: heparinase II/III domain-containing protein [Myxococcota bacterium]